MVKISKYSSKKIKYYIKKEYFEFTYSPVYGILCVEIEMSPVNKHFKLKTIGSRLKVPNRGRFKRWGDNHQ